ncbi:MAG TPA: 1-deoxy-D-xylulose-5-phosphate reductoisomerase [Tepidisphaeraceae bacterium]|nr:1-deoxy-D-xylulose-5-phosphate reductoisomerase [Tepidisphaeraceae bacterium]
MAHRLAILGSTGSIGVSALEVVHHLGLPYRAVGLSAHRHAGKLLEQARKFRPAAVAITDPEAAEEVAGNLADLNIKLHRGPSGLVDLVRRDDVDTVLAAVVGAAGLPAALAAVRAGKRLALANKESLVVAGSLLIPEARKHGVKIIPVDSEHSAVFQAMQSGKPSEVRRVILTASGGPFRNHSPDRLRHVTVADALNHPTWRMGTKVTIDSATLLNKGLELIEACWLFDIPPSKVQVVIHPESVVHSMVEFVDGSVLAQLSPPDMKTPIQYALTFPDRADGCSRRMDWQSAFSLQFEPPDFGRFPALKLAYQVAETGGTAGAVLNAANESAVAAFLDGRIAFDGICRVVETTIARHTVMQRPSLDDLLSADDWARQTAQSLVAEPGSLVTGGILK